MAQATKRRTTLDADDSDEADDDIYAKEQKIK
jgi:uncharacterized membrane protein